MNKATKVISTACLAVGLALGGNVVAAQAAEAATYSNYIARIAPGSCELRQYVNYDWWEETFQGKHDYSYRLYSVTCPAF